jgi:replicative DNA helicase
MSRPASSDPFLDKGLPSNIEAERSILGAILLDNTLCNQAIELLRREDFFLDSHRRIYDKMIALIESGQPIDFITLTDELRRAGEFEQVGGATYIASLIDGVPRTDTIEHYAKIVKSKAMLRRLITASNQIIARCFDEDTDADTIIDEAEQMIFQIAEDRIRQGFQYIGEVAQRRLEQIEQMAGRPEMITGVPTGFTDFDQLTSGLQRQDLIIIAARPSQGKCLAFDSEIVLIDGSIATIEEIYRAGRSCGLLTLRGDLTFVPVRASAFVDDGIKPVFRVTTQLGRAVESTLSHPFLTIEGWRALAELKPGDKIAVPGKLAVFGQDQMRECEVKLLGYLISSDCLKQSNLQFSTSNQVLREDFEGALAEFERSKPTTELSSSVSQSCAPDSIDEWLKSLGAYGFNSRAKFIPAPVFKLRRELIALFLNRLFATSGWVLLNGKSGCQIGYQTMSERLARGCQHLLVRFGIIAKLERKSHNGSLPPAWQLEISDAQSIRLFASEIGMLGREKELAAVLGFPQQVAEAKVGLTQRASFNSLSQHSSGASSLLHQPSDDEQPQYSATGDVYWDEIVSIEPAGYKQVYDLTIPETHNFVANDICVHNTAFALNIAQYAAKNGNVVGIFSLEMSAEQLVSRLLCSEARIDAHRLRTGYLNREEWARLADALRRLCEVQIFIDDTPSQNVLEMRAKARRLKAEHGLDLLIIDYLQLMTGRGRIESRQQEVSQIARDLKGLAKELDIPVVALSQLTRGPEMRTDHRPQLSDLRESGALEQDADVVCFIYREEVYDPDNAELHGKAELLLRKQRNGPIGDVPLVFIKEFTRFENMIREE